jgi:type VI secretion system protein ImpJ
MLKLPKIANRVHWNEGMLLASQHFQHADHYVETLLAHQLKRVSRFYWGVNRVEHDAVAMASGEFRLTGFEGVFPDGSVAQFGSAEESDEQSPSDQPVTLTFDDLEIPLGSVVTVVVSMAMYNAQCASDLDSERRRFISVNEGALADIGDSQNEVDLVSLQPMLRLGIERDRSPNHTALPIARVKKMLDGSYQLMAYTPPQLAAVAGYTTRGSDIWQRIAEIVANARVKAVQLRSLIVDRRSDQVMLEKQRSRIIALTRLLPALEAQLGAQAHPFDVYCRLVDYASDLATLRDDPVPPVFTKYIHNDTADSFAPVFAFVEEVIESVHLDYTILQFAINGDGNLTCELPRALRGGSLLLAFQAPNSVDKDTVGEWVDNAYICSEEDYEQLSLRRDIGFERERTRRFDKFNLVESANELLYKISLPDQEVATLLVTGSDKELDLAKPQVVLCFIEQST